MLEMGRNGLMYISLEVGERDVSGIGRGEVESGFIEMSLVVGWLLVVEVEVCCIVAIGSNIGRV